MVDLRRLTIFREAIEHVQVIVTTHSADLLDRDTIAQESILAVEAEHGETRIAPLDETATPPAVTVPSPRASCCAWIN